MHCPFEQTFDASAHGAASEHAADMQSPEAAQISPAPHDDTEHGAMHVPLTHKFERHSAFSAHGVPFVFCASEDSPQPAAANDNADKTRIARFNRIETSLCETEPGLKSGYTDIQIEYKANRRMTADCAEKTGIAPSIYLDFSGKRRAVRQKNASARRIIRIAPLRDRTTARSIGCRRGKRRRGRHRCICIRTDR